jgi:murein L,D-transpeptidase YcbB/YkuD
MKIYLSIYFLTICINIFSCDQKKQWPEKNTVVDIIHQSIPINSNDLFKYSESKIIDSGDLFKFFIDFPKFQFISKDIKYAYTVNHYNLFWKNKNQLNINAKELIFRLDHLKLDGLPEEFIYKSALKTMIGKNVISPELDIMLTAQYINYAQKVNYGLVREQADVENWNLTLKQRNVKLYIDSFLMKKELIFNFSMYDQYQLLKSELNKYFQIETQKWEKIKDNKIYKIGDTAHAILIAKQKLHNLGDLKRFDSTILFDSVLFDGIKNLQQRMGLVSDGRWTKKLINILNTEIEEWIKKIKINMERYRWLPQTVSGDYLLVNIPAFKLFIYEKNNLKWDMKVIVGKYKNKTVVFEGKVKYVVFCPYWNIPESILNKEILPALKNNPAYLVNHHMEWDGNSIRQLPGEDNSLGLIKFLFPNKYNIYLHDTPFKSLFNNEQRSFSHGCIRIENAKKLAFYLLKDQVDWSEITIEKAMNEKVERFVEIMKPLPIYITYFTSWVDEKGKIQFRNDIYNWDNRIFDFISNEKLGH